MSLLDWQFFCDWKGGLESTFFHLFLTQEQLAMHVCGEGSISPNTPEGKWRKRKNKNVCSTKHQTVYKRVRKWAVIQSTTVDLLAERERERNITSKKEERCIVSRYLKPHIITISGFLAGRKIWVDKMIYPGEPFS